MIVTLLNGRFVDNPLDCCVDSVGATWKITVDISDITQICSIFSMWGKLVQCFDVMIFSPTFALWYPELHSGQYLL